MSVPELPVEAGGPSAAPGALQRVTGVVAVFGGLLALAVAILVTVSVSGRWLFGKPIDGDFEFVKMATAVAVFCYLPYTQARRGNIMVDTFTMRLPQTTQRRIDAFWDVVYALAMGALAYALFNGTMDSIRSGETTMQRQILLWPSIGLAAILCALLSATAFLSARALLSGKQP
jgi:TRAP-type C4-dicarboxylate transport system permease small subunit